MQPHDTLFTPTEAAVLTGLPLKAVNNAIDKKTVSAIAGDDAGRNGPRRSTDRCGYCAGADLRPRAVTYAADPG